MPKSPRKTEYRCPGCGFAQLEPVDLISTYCRGCGDHYSVVDEAEAAEAEAPDPGQILLVPIVYRPVVCFHCGESHRVPESALNTQCPSCHACIEFEDITVTTNVSRPIDTRGHVEVTKSGYLNSSRTICGSARIDGRLSGALECFGELRLGGGGRLTGAVEAGTVVVERHAQVGLAHPLHAYRLSVQGHLEATVYCAGSVRITRGGMIRGDIYAHSLIVEQGGTYVGNSVIRHVRSAPESAGQPSSGEPGWEPDTLFARLSPA